MFSTRLDSPLFQSNFFSRTLLFSFPHNVPNNGSSKGACIQSLIARKKLSINETIINSSDVDHLKLKKSTLKTILKKQFCKQISSKLISDKSLVAFGGAIGNNLKKLYLQSRFNLFAKSSSNSYLPHELKQYRKIMISSKQLKNLFIQPFNNLPESFLKNVGINKGLVDLSLYMNRSQFIELSFIFKHIIHLKKFTLQLHFNECRIAKNKAVISFTNFINFLSSSKNLEILHLTVGSELVYGNNQGAMKLFSCLGDLNLSDLKLNVSIPGQVLNPSKIEKFLAKIDYLQIQQGQKWMKPSFESKKSLNLATFPFEEFYPHELVTKCSSLKGLKLESNGKTIPQDLGLAKNIVDFSIDIQVKSDEMVSSHLSRLCDALSQANSLETFSLSFSGLEGNSLGQLDDLHKLLSHIQIKHYKLKLSPDFDNCDDTQLGGLLNQLTAIQTLESLSLAFDSLNDAHPFKVLLKSFPKLLSLNIKVKAFEKPESSFPFEDLIHLSSLEALMILIPPQNKNDVLNRLPYLERLKKLKIGTDGIIVSHVSHTITIKDYLLAKSASLFAKQS